MRVAVFRVVDAAKAAAESACDKQLSTDVSTQERLRGAALRVSVSQVQQWKALSEQAGVHVAAASVDVARGKFYESALRHGHTAFKDSRVSAAIAEAVTTLPSTVVDAFGGPAGVTAALSARSTGDSGISKATVVETFTVTLPLHAMSPDFVLSDDK